MATVVILVNAVTIKTMRNLAIDVATNVPTYIFMKSVSSLFYFKQRWNETKNYRNNLQHNISQIPSNWVRVFLCGQTKRPEKLV